MSGQGFSKYDRVETFQSVYCYSDSEVLINIPDIRDQEILNAFEEEVTRIRQMMIEEEATVTGRFSTSHLLNIHKYIFQDVYPFAGKFRTEDIHKGNTMFCKSEFIAESLKKLLFGLKEEKFLKGLSREVFVQRIAYYFIELNMIHPFREGNGRAIRMFIRQLSVKCKLEIDWTVLNKDELLKAMIAGVDREYEPLEACIHKAIIE